MTSEEFITILKECPKELHIFIKQPTKDLEFIQLAEITSMYQVEINGTKMLVIDTYSNETEESITLN